jgi:hypothetical protein
VPVANLRVVRRVLVLFALLLAAVAVPAQADSGPPECGAQLTTLTGRVSSADAKTYRMLPFSVPEGTTRIEVGYSWTDSQTVLDLGLWDADGFRGWSGSRQSTVWIQPDGAERGYLPGPIDAGTWFVDLGIATVGPTGSDWAVRVRCTDPPTGPTPAPDPVDAAHVADPRPGWYFGDMHMHGYHSAANGPSWESFVAQARAAQLDFLPVTDYVTTRHWSTLGSVQRANPDLVIWPGREIITYFGHANAIGETPSTAEYRHGFGGVTLAGIQAATRADGALFQVNHPTFFPGPFANFCRGCEMTAPIDWSQVDTLEVLTGPAAANTADLGAPASPANGQNPFVVTALDLWDSLLMKGHRITAVSGSDSKGNEPNAAERTRRGYGSSATAVWADQLSRPALKAAIKAGHVYVAARGVTGSPRLGMTATSGDQQGMFGDALVADTADVTVTVAGGRGQVLKIVRNGRPHLTVPVTSDDFSFSFPAVRGVDGGPAGTYYRVETADSTSVTTIGNPIFLTAPG